MLPRRLASLFSVLVCVSIGGGDGISTRSAEDKLQRCREASATAFVYVMRMRQFIISIDIRTRNLVLALFPNGGLICLSFSDFFLATSCYRYSDVIPLEKKGVFFSNIHNTTGENGWKKGKRCRARLIRSESSNNGPLGVKVTRLGCDVRARDEKQNISHLKVRCVECSGI